MAYTLRITGIKELAKNFHSGPATVRAATVQAITELIDDGHEVAHRRAPGILKEKLRKKVTSSKTKVVGTLRVYYRVRSLKTGKRHNLGSLVEGGTRPHALRPARGRAMVLTAGGQVLVRAGAKHPGSKPHKFMEPAFEEIERQEEPVLDRAMEKVVNELTR